jgi:hypothetical protein
MIIVWSSTSEADFKVCLEIETYGLALKALNLSFCIAFSLRFKISCVVYSMEKVLEKFSKRIIVGNNARLHVICICFVH